MNLPWVIYDGNGTTTQFNVPFPYLRKEHVKVTIDDNPVTFTFVNTSRIALNTAPASGKKLVVERLTPSIPLYVIADGQPIPAKHHNEMLLQCMYRAEEKETISLIAQMQQLVDQATAQKNAAQAAKTAAESAKTAAETAKTQAQTAKTQAETAKNAAETARTQAQTAKTQSEAASTSAHGAKETAIANKNAATTARDAAITAKNEAVTAKNESVVSKNLSVNAKNETVTAKNQAVAAKDTAVAAAASATAIAGFDPSNYLAKAGGIMGGEINSRASNGYRLSGGSAQAPAAILHKNAHYFYVLLTNENDRDGAYNTLRPFMVRLTSGDVTFSHNVDFAGEIQAKYMNALRFVGAGATPSVITRKDGNNFYFLLTDASSPYGNFNNLRPFYINLINGRVVMNEGLNVANSISITSGYLKVGDAFYYNNGAIKGAIWEDWHGSGWAKTAIATQITTEATAIATQIVNNALNAFKNNPQFTGTLKVTGGIKATGNIEAYTS